MRILDLARIVASHAAGDLDYSPDPMDIISELAVIYGRDYPGDAEAGWVYDGERRLAPVTPDLNVEGRFLQVDFVGHVPAWHLFRYESRSDLEAKMLGGGGYLNQFTSTTVIIHNGEVLPFSVFFRDPSGRERLFEKRRQLENDAFGTKYPNPRIEWQARL